jgi:endonuclease YncB( thermonuclease family)
MRPLLFAAVTLCVASPARANWLLDVDEAEVLKVTNGDALKLRVTVSRLGPAGMETRVSDEAIRLIGVICPASSEGKKCGTWRKQLTCRDEVKLGKSVVSFVKRLLPEGTKVPLRLRGRDRNGRTLGYIELPNGGDLGQKLVETGRCRAWSHQRPHQLQHLYEDAVPKAK